MIHINDLRESDARGQIPIHEEWTKIYLAVQERGVKSVAHAICRTEGQVKLICNVVDRLSAFVMKLMRDEKLTRGQLYMIAKLPMSEQYGVALLSQSRTFQFTRTLCKLIKENEIDPS
jgi:hypothetical protein